MTEKLRKSAQIFLEDVLPIKKMRFNLVLVGAVAGEKSKIISCYVLLS